MAPAVAAGAGEDLPDIPDFREREMAGIVEVVR